ncbi:MAG: nicotinate (nicotinamide) nucleotide adenylyltransferase [Spirochaetota bacterium]
MKLAIFGGSFDPPHQGHAKIIETFWQLYPKTSKLYFIPNRISPFKTEKALNASQTLEICQLFLQGLPGYNEIWQGELQKTGKSYTIDTVEELQKKHPNNTFYLLIGSDNAQSIHTWKDFARIQEVCEIIVFRRPGSLDAIHSYKTLTNPVLDASSSEIRRQLQQGEKPQYLSSQVYQYILNRGLYATTDSPR